LSVKRRTSCRACGGESLTQYLDLGVQAPANALRPPLSREPEFEAPLSVSWCADCGLSQLDHVVDPKILYADYPFRAGTSQLWRQHCVGLMNAVVEKSHKGFLLDIGSNDGALLEEAHLRGFKVLGIDPSDTGNAKIPMLERFWNTDTAKEVTKCFRQADVITATNVFGHVDDAGDFLEGVAIALRPNGIAIIECPHILPLLENVAFDTIYHEHLSYWSLRPLELLAERVGLKVVDVRMFPELHGGTMRYTLKPGEAKPSPGVAGVRILENALYLRGLEPYREFTIKARDKIAALKNTLTAERRAGKRVWGYGANAKGAVFLQAAGLSEVTLERVVDDCAAKHGFLMPGTGIPITNANALAEPDILVLLSWNNAKDLQVKAAQRGFAGQFVLPSAA
jgi:SAM-dependent methyltransferase